MANLALNMEILDLLNKESVSGASSLVELVYKFDGPTANGESIAKVRFKYFWGYTNIYIYIYGHQHQSLYLARAARGVIS